nr:protein RIK-like isoform X1 [Nicotiana tomentosiformis]XP_018632456.1 protein RIK-like isoform X1 [Nicotiana tomentosiformis]
MDSISPFGCQNSLQGSELPTPQKRMSDAGDRYNIGAAPKKLVQPLSSPMAPPPPRTMPSPPPPPPPKFHSSTEKVHANNVAHRTPCKIVPDTLVQLMEYGDDDDDDDTDEAIDRPLKSSSNVVAAPKPFWAV